MSQELQQYFLQSVTINDNKVPRDWIFTAVYVEKASLKAPLLKLEIHDITGTIIDDWKAKYGASLVAEMGDPQGNAGTFKTTFFVTSAMLAGDVVTVIAVSEDVRRFKIPSPRTNLHTNKTPDAIFKVYAGDQQIAGSAMKRAVTYHLNAGEKPSKMFAEMARDKGALCWTCRGQFNFYSLADLIKQQPSFTYEGNNPQAEYTLSKMRLIQQDHAVTATNQYRFVGYSMTDGYIECGDSSLPVRYISDSDMETLRNMQLSLVPKLDIEVAGNPEIKPGMVIEILVYRYDQENRLDESLPRKMIVKNVAHFEDRVGYTTRIILGVPNSEA
ncbi:tail length tape measure protein [Salmonella enterica]|uniref:Tail length tape measure protein n=1 Tax=Salmonella enterica TaxID=28901 RepID=A0A5U1A8S7_SALER|nr:tail length tape measure protein [Salmonella enterica]EBT5201770.1 tail length tape measure protein [Salmonella enterica subsp. enterica serovar 4,[5],12:i:-]ECC8687041.1 tail length tape measure protein [Salmonella enterica subsp. enterica]ECN6793132.1 tail length tape measure protein [Salmonella enterica subsp. enterica serovar Typhimurium]ECT0233801.1 tail length tape measure protein [Salmonella enterica subsp. enterica serovar Derby]